ncbi:MAG: FHA domain-containing protein [Candidatus Hydrogenedentes bacterium]|nr:FHA domain-containing protein [Candidatus Hydrogenedentota bacterium]
MASVTIEQPGVPTMTVPLSGNEISFGRSEESDVVLVADEVSRHHAKICRRGENMVLVDLKSLNGTYVNRQRIVERVLSHMDEIWFGSRCNLVYRNDTQLSAKEKEAKAEAEPDRQVERDMDKIREEMDRVGNSMTMIGRKTPFIAAEVKAKTAEADSADIVKMSRAYRRMAALHKASQIMASNFDLKKRLSDVLDLVMEVLEADRGFVMLREEDSNNLNVKVAREMGRELEASSPSMGIAGRAAIDGESVLMADRASDKEFGMRESIIRHEILSAMCVPLKIKDRILGSIYIDTRRPDITFSEEDLELFASLSSQSALAIDNVRLHDQVVEAEKKRSEFGRFLSPGIVDRIMNEAESVELGGQRAMVTTLFCDIRGFTNMTEKITPTQLMDLLNEYFTAMTRIIFDHKGTLDKYVGDEIMAVFGAPVSTGDDEYQAVASALAIQKKNAELNVTREREGRPTFELGIGIDTGDVFAGYFGSPMRMEYTVVGDRVNTASRFCSMAGPGKVIVGNATWEKIQDRVVTVPIGAVMLKGKEQEVHAHEIVALKESEPAEI